MATGAHVSRVRSLYKRLLVLHRFLPIDLRALGDQYVKDEFRRHKSASSEEVQGFMREWEVKQTLLMFGACWSREPESFKNSFNSSSLLAFI